MSAPNQQDIESRLWEAANVLRGPVDPSKVVATLGADGDVAANFQTFAISSGCIR